MVKTLTNHEQETVIDFNKEEKMVHIFTYEKTWQKHLEKKLGLKPIMANGHGGKEYEKAYLKIKEEMASLGLSFEQAVEGGGQYAQSTKCNYSTPRS